MKTEEETIGQRIKSLIHELRITSKGLSDEIKCSPVTIHNIIKDISKPGFDVLAGILKNYPNVSEKWLMSGDGPMFINSEPKPVAMSKPEDGYLEAFLKQLEDKWKLEYGKIMDEKDAIISNQRFIIDTLLSSQKTQLGKLNVGEEILPVSAKVIEMPIYKNVA